MKKFFKDCLPLSRNFYPHSAEVNINLVNALSNPNAIGTRRRLKRINKRSATHKLANRWLNILCMDLEKENPVTVVFRL